MITIGVEPDGFNINQECGSTDAGGARAPRCARCAPTSASRSTATPTASCVVDERGHVVDGDQLMAVIAESWKADGRLAKPGIVATVMSNLGLERYLGGLGLTLARTAVGDRYVLEQMREHGYNLGGEASGHIILSDYATTGDGLVAALQVLAVVKKHGQAGVRGLPPLRAAAADPAQRPLQEGQAAGGRQGACRRSRAPSRSSTARAGW